MVEPTTDDRALSTSPDEFDLVIEAGRSLGQDWRDLWRYRGLLYFLAWRDVLVRYKQTAIGMVWAVIRPFLTMVVFAVIFGRIAGLPSDPGTPYPVMVFAAMLPWQLFAGALQGSSESLVSNAHIISKVYFPRVIIPASALVVNLIDFVVSLAILVALMGWYHAWPTWRVLTLPLLVLLALLASWGMGLLFAALSVKYRDFRYVIPFAVQLGVYVSPVGFSSAIVPERWRLLYSLNPMVGVIDGFRWALFSSATPMYMPGLLASIGVSVALALVGFAYFRSTERVLADVI